MCVEQNCPVGSAGCRRRGDCPWDRNTGTRKLGRWGIWRPAFACCATTEPPLTERPPPPAPAARRLSLCHGPWSTMSLAPGRVGPFGCPFAGGEDVRLRLALTAGLGFRLAHRERLLVNQIDLHPSKGYGRCHPILALLHYWQAGMTDHADMEAEVMHAQEGRSAPRRRSKRSKATGGSLGRACSSCPESAEIAPPDLP